MRLLGQAGLCLLCLLGHALLKLPCLQGQSRGYLLVGLPVLLLVGGRTKGQTLTPSAVVGGRNEHTAHSDILVVLIRYIQGWGGRGVRPARPVKNRQGSATRQSLPHAPLTRKGLLPTYLPTTLPTQIDGNRGLGAFPLLYLSLAWGHFLYSQSLRRQTGG